MKNALLTALAVLSLSSTGTYAREIAHFDFTQPNPKLLVTDEASSQDLHSRSDLGSVSPSVHALLNAFERLAVNDSTALSARAPCSVSHWKPLSLQPVIELRRARYFPAMARAACRYGIPVNLFDALIIRRAATTPSPAASKALPVSPSSCRTPQSQMHHQRLEHRAEPEWRRSGPQAHLAEFGRYDLALAAYNAGPGRVRPRHPSPPLLKLRITSPRSSPASNAMQSIGRMWPMPSVRMTAST
jgi:hypothetical protein